MERRDFLAQGAAVGALGLGVEGCSSIDRGAAEPHARGVDPRALADMDIDAFLARLDASRDAIHRTATLDAVLPHDARERTKTDPRYAHGEELIRKTMRTLLLVGSFGDLPEAGRAHPAVQERLWSSLAEMDEAVLGMRTELVSYTPTERADVARALREDPALGERILDALDREAIKAGVNEKRRAHLRSVGQVATFRLKQSTSSFIDEYDETVAKVEARSGTLEESQRRMMSQMGERAFWDLHARQTAYAAAWRAQLAPQPGTPNAPGAPPPPVSMTPTSEPPPPPPPPGTFGGPPVAPPPPGEEEEHPKRGTTVLIVGASLLGLGAILGATGGALLASSGGAIGGAIVLTFAALAGLAGIICLIVGAVLRANS